MKVLVSGTPKCVGGIGTLIENIAVCNIDAKKPMELSFLLQQGSVYTERLLKLGYPVYEIPRLSNPVVYYRAINNILKKNKFDIVWINNSSKIDVILPYLGHVHGAKNAIHTHGVDTEERGVKRIIFAVLEKLLGRFYESMADCAIACSIDAAKHFFEDKKNLNNCLILNNGIFVDKFVYDLNKRRKIRNELDMREDTVLLGTVGRLTRVKNYSFILKIAAQLSAKYQFIILGDGEDKEKLTEEIAILGIADRVHLLGKKDNVDEYLSAMDIYLMPSLHEGSPLSLIEAQCSGLSCIVSENISKTVDLTGLVNFLQIDTTQTWVSRCIQCTNISDRQHYSEILNNKGYNITEAYKQLYTIFWGCRS